MEDADANRQSEDSDTEPDPNSDPGTEPDSDPGTDTKFPHVAGFALSAILLVVAFVGATTAGILDSVGPYLLGVSVLVAVLFLFGR